MSTDSRFTHKIWQEQELSKMVKGGVPFPMLTGWLRQDICIFLCHGGSTPAQNKLTIQNDFSFYCCNYILHGQEPRE
jgi:hypothetical protein